MNKSKRIPGITAVMGDINDDAMIKQHGFNRYGVHRCNIKDCKACPEIMIQIEGIPHTIGLCEYHYYFISHNMAGPTEYVFDNYSAFSAEYSETKYGKYRSWWLDYAERAIYDIWQPAEMLKCNPENLHVYFDSENNKLCQAFKNNPECRGCIFGSPGNTPGCMTHFPKYKLLSTEIYPAYVNAAINEPKKLKQARRKFTKYINIRNRTWRKIYTALSATYDTDFGKDCFPGILKIGGKE